MRKLSIKGARKSCDGYLGVAGKGKATKLIHTHIAELALGKSLPKKAIVHHVDGNKHNNENSNLVICPDQAYHKLIHMRQDALEASGNANYRKCKYCKKYDDPKNLMIYSAGARGYNVFHRDCHLPVLKKAYLKRKAKNEQPNNQK